MIGQRAGTPPASPARSVQAARRWEWVGLAGIVGLAILARMGGLAQGFPHEYHWDERLYFHASFYTLANSLAHDSTTWHLIHSYRADLRPFVLPASRLRLAAVALADRPLHAGANLRLRALLP